MALKLRDKQFRLAKISHLDFKTIEMDRVLTGLFARINHKGMDSRLMKGHSTIEDFVAHFLENPDRFRGFERFPFVLRGWLETHLLDLVNRGKQTQAVAAPRPLHGYTYRFRNPKFCRDYGAAEHLYEMLWHARNDTGKRALDRLRNFFFEGIDPQTEREDASVMIDVETQALLSLSHEKMTQDAPLPGSREPFAPLCIGSADFLANDVIRLLTYHKVIPRTVMVEYLKVLLAFHLALYHLRLMKMLPVLVRKRGVEPICQPNRCPVKPLLVESPHGDCPHRVGIFVDVQSLPDRRVAALAIQSAEFQYRRIPGFIRAYFLTKKLDEFGQSLLQLGKLQGGARRKLTVWEVLQLQEDVRSVDRKGFFNARLMNLLEDARGEDNALDPEIEKVIDQNLDEMDKYIECLLAVRSEYHRAAIVKALDSLLLKNRPGALLAQARAPRAPRRFVLDSRLLEVLLQIAVLRFDSQKKQHRTEEIRIEELLTFIRERYGLFVDRLPIGEGFGEPSIQDREALRENKEAFKNKLRDIGFFQELSDAYITQHVTPRYRIGEKEPRQVNGIENSAL